MARLLLRFALTLPDFHTSLRIPRAEGKERKLELLRQSRAHASNYFPVPSPQVSVRAIHDTIEGTNDELIVRGPGKVEMEGTIFNPTCGEWPDLKVTISLTEAVSES